MPREWANFTDNGVSIVGSMGGIAAIRAAPWLAFSEFQLPLSKIQPPTKTGGWVLPDKGITPENYFHRKTYTEMEQILMKKFGPQKGGGPNNKSFYNAKTGRTFNLHQDPTHRAGRPHIDIKKRGLPKSHYKDQPFFLKEKK